MYTPNPLDTLFHIVQLLHVRTHLFREPYQDLPKLDFHLRERLFKDYDYRAMVQALRDPLRPGMAYSCVDAFGSHYVSFLLDTGGDPPPYEFVVIGPYNYRRVSEEDIARIIENYKIPSRFHQDLVLGLGHVPRIEQREFWVSLLIFLISGLICKDKQLEFHSSSDISTVLPDFIRTVYNSEQSEEYRTSTLAKGYSWEEELLNAVKRGNVDQATLLATKYVNFQRNYHQKFGLKPQYAAIELNALLRRAAMETGVHILRLDETFVKYNRLVDQQDQIPVQTTYRDMVTEYCKLVAKYSQSNYSVTVRKSLDFIDFNYQQGVSLHKLATMFNVSDGYLSTSFKKEVGMSITDYLNRARVSHARWLLESTNDSIQAIGEQCGFSDASYFTRIFKRYTGQSPLQYRISRTLLNE